MQSIWCYSDLDSLAKPVGEVAFGAIAAEPGRSRNFAMLWSNPRQSFRILQGSENLQNPRNLASGCS
jgi:hypothetical protein